MSNRFDPNRPQADGRDPKSTRKVIKPATQHTGEVRLIGGQWKRSKLPVADRPGLRPTPDRVRETLFNWLGQDLSGWRVLDAFAGSGALGFEAASRGAPGRFERVLLDPPFQGDHLQPALSAAASLVAPGGFLYVESASPLAEPPAKHSLHRQLKAGAVHAQLWLRQA